MAHYKKPLCVIIILFSLFSLVSCGRESVSAPGENFLAIEDETQLPDSPIDEEFDDDLVIFDDEDVPMSEFPDFEVTPEIVDESPFEIQIEVMSGVVTVSGTNLIAEASAVIDLVNNEREAAGLSVLTHDGVLDETALIRAAEITNTWSHTRPNGSKWSTLSSELKGENLGSGYATSARAIRGWMNSPTHKSLILHTEFTRCGAAAVKVNGRVFWAFHFGK